MAAYAAATDKIRITKNWDNKCVYNNEAKINPLLTPSNINYRLITKRRMLSRPVKTPINPPTSIVTTNKGNKSVVVMFS
jgi:hypothetical protein